MFESAVGIRTFARLEAHANRVLGAVQFDLCYHYIRVRGLGGDGPEDINSFRCSQSFSLHVVTSRISKTSPKKNKSPSE